MNHPIPDTADRSHADMQHLLPWWVNGSLDDTERGMVERHVQNCAACRREAAQLRHLQAAIQSEPGDVAATLGLGRLRARIAPAHPHGRSGWRAWPIWHWLGGPRAMPMALIAGLLGVAVGLLVWGALRGPAETMGYRTLSAVPAQPGPQAHITVVFDGRTSEGEMRALLLSLHANVVGGPTPEGAYLLAVPTASQDAALARLRSLAPHAVRLAEPAAAQP